MPQSVPARLAAMASGLLAALSRVAASMLIVAAVAFGALGAILAGCLMALAGLFPAPDRRRPATITVRARRVRPAAGWSPDAPR